MIEPDDFGLGEVQTFAHIGDPLPAPNHSVFWKHWFDGLVSASPVLAVRNFEDASDPSATHEFVSHGDVRIGCRLVLPQSGQPIRASLVVVHGYAKPEPLEESVRRWKTIAESGVAVLIIRLRGYRGSQVGIGEQLSPDALGAGWIGRGFTGASHDDWILPAAVADVCNACRVMRNALLKRDTDVVLEIDPSLDHPAVYLAGTSLGGGLATIAAGQLIGKLSGESIVDRLAILQPSLGAWRWRLRQQATGTTREIDSLLRHFPDRREELIDRLRLCDAVVHGRKVRVPTLGVLARKDDVVPAPSAAAVFNSIDADPGRKWRFVVPFGHFEGSIANARRHGLAQRAINDFFDPRQLPIDSMGRWDVKPHDDEQPVDS